MLIDNLMNDPGDDIWYDQTFRITLEDHLTWLKNNSGTLQITIAANDAYKYEGDFFGLLNKYNAPPYLHWIIMRMNGLTSPSDSDASINTLLVPNLNVLDNIRQSYISMNRLTS